MQFDLHVEGSYELVQGASIPNLDGDCMNTSLSPKKTYPLCVNFFTKSSFVTIKFL